jgi:C-terminal processing protease CtpA/Prc
MLIGSVDSSNERHGAIGIRISSFTHKILKVYKNTPAEKAGLQVGDKIIWTVDEDYKNEITGVPGSLVKLTVERDNVELTFNIERAPERTIVRR